MTDYATKERKRFLRQCAVLAALRWLYVVICGLSLGGLAAIIIAILTRKP